MAKSQTKSKTTSTSTNPATLTDDELTSPFLLDKEIVPAYWDARRYMQNFFDPLDEFERLADNRVRGDKPEGFPDVNDGTLAAMLVEIPMEILGQMVRGTVKVRTVQDPETGEMVEAPGWLKEVANIVWEKKIIPNANTDTSFYIKCVIVLYRALKYGGQPSYDFFTAHGDDYGADMMLPYVKDVYLESGAKSDTSANHIFMDSYFSRLAIRRIIATAKKIDEDNEAEQKQYKADLKQYQADMQAAEGRVIGMDGEGNPIDEVGLPIQMPVEPAEPVPIDQPWIIDNLKKVLVSAIDSEKDARNQNAEEREKGISQSGIKFTTLFQRGYEAPFETFHEGLGDDDASGLLKLKRMKNDDRSGEMPVKYMFVWQNLENPLGRGKVEMAGGNQNVADYMTQADVLGTGIGLRPPIGIRGNRATTDLKSLIWAPDQFWFEGDAVVDVKQTNNSTYTQLPSRYSMYKSQVLNLLAKTDASISAEAGAPGFSKTDAGVKFQATRAGISANFMRQMFNQWFNRLASSMLNKHFANMEGKDVMDVTREEAMRLQRAGLIDSDPNTPEPSVEEIKLVWENMRGVFEFEVDPESSILKENEEIVGKLIEAIKLAVENPQLQQQMIESGAEFKIGEAYKALFNRFGLPDVEKIVVPIEKQLPGQAPGVDGGIINPQEAAALAQGVTGGQPPAAPPQAPPQAPPAQPPLPAPAGPPAPPAGPPGPPQAPPQQLPPELAAAIQEVQQQYGVDEQAAVAVLQARQMGIPEDMIAQYIQGGSLEGVAA